VGRLTLVDPDRVEETNLHRQPLYRMSELGQLKVHAARESLLALNPQVLIEARAETLTPASAPQLVAAANVVLDAADSFAATYTLSDECRRQGKVLVSASVLGLAGYVGAFCGQAPSYRAVFPEMPPQVGSCSTSGVLGTAVGVMGTLQAHMTLALLLDLTPSMVGEMRSVDFHSLRISSFSFLGASEPADSESAPAFIASADVAANDVVIDLRTLAEAPVSPFAGALRIGVDQVEAHEPALPREGRIVLCCRSGVRAWRAARVLQRSGHSQLALLALG
jgi:molybdopterin/thiamine biosynthesis adenylyltransferase/rhodanese-related sulfurtransferase